MCVCSLSSDSPSHCSARESSSSSPLPSSLPRAPLAQHPAEHHRKTHTHTSFHPYKNSCIVCSNIILCKSELKRDFFFFFFYLISLFQNSPLCRPPFPAGVAPVLSQIQRAQLLNSQVTNHPLTITTSHHINLYTAIAHILYSLCNCNSLPFCRSLSLPLPPPCLLQVGPFPHGAGPAPPMLPGAAGGFRPYFGQPPPRVGPHGPHPNHAPLSSHAPIRHNTTHLHPQHRRMLTQRMQSRGCVYL